MSELNVEIKTEIYKKIEELNLETFVLICKIDRYKDKMTEPLYNHMTGQLCEIYKNELANAAGDYLIQRAKEQYERDARKAVFVPQISKYLHFRNKAAKLIDQKVAQEAEEFFAHCGELRAKLDEAVLPPRVGDRGQKPVSDNVADDQSRRAAPPTCENALPTPQKSRKQESGGKDRAADETPISPKSGESKKKEKTE